MSRRKYKVYFNFLKRTSLTKRSALKAFIEQIFKKEGKDILELQYVFCSDDYLLSINKKFLKHDFYTDIITFDLSAGEGISAEVYISIDRVRENALSLKVSLNEEIRRVLFHGALHLCGYKDKNPSDIKLMRQKEDHYLSKFKKSLVNG